MISKEQYDNAIKAMEVNQDIINKYHKEKADLFKKRLEDNPIFTDDELLYSAWQLCPCGHGIAYPKDCGGHHYWNCSAILKGIADKDVLHTGQLPFSMYSVKSENSGRGSTRGVFNPQKKK